MTNSKISVRYAKALFATAKEKNILDAIKNDVDTMYSTIKESAELAGLLESPTINGTKKFEILKQIFDKDVNSISIQFLELVAKNKREAFLTGILHYFIVLFKKDKNIMDAIITTSIALTEDQQEKVAKVLKNTYKADIELTQKVDPNIIGGFIVRIEDKQLDSSIIRKLSDIKQSFMNASLN